MLKRLRIKFVVLNMVLIAIVMTLVSVVICVVSYNANVSRVYAELDDALTEAARPDDIFDILGYTDALSFGGPGFADGFWFIGGDEADSYAEDGRPGGYGGFDSRRYSGDEALYWDYFDGEDLRSDGDYGYDAGLSDDASALWGYWSDTGSSQSDSDASDSSWDGLEGNLPTIGGTLSGDSVPIAVYRIEAGLYYSPVPRVSSATIDSETLEAAFQELSTSEGERGLLEDVGLYFAKRGGSEDYLVAFADSSVVDSWHRLALLCAAVEVAALLLFLIINLFFSRWAIKPIEEAWSRQQQFIADASHELKTPLTVILANTSILLGHPEKTIAEESQWVESTQTEAKNMQDLIGEMLEIAQSQKDSDAFELGTSLGKAAEAGEPIDFSDLLEGELLQFESVAFERGVTIESDLVSGLRVCGSKDRLRRLIGTLVDNACKYSDIGGVVRVTLSASGKNLVLVVNNRGSVIDAEDLEHIFDRFYRTDKARSRSEGGYGLGLSIARDVVQEHGGTIVAESDSRAGTSFTVGLPLA